MNSSQETVGAAAAKLSPPVAVLAAEILGMTVADWIQWLTLIYLLLMVCHKAWGMWREFKEYWFAKPGQKQKTSKEVRE